MYSLRIRNEPIYVYKLILVISEQFQLSANSRLWVLNQYIMLKIRRKIWEKKRPTGVWPWFVGGHKFNSTAIVNVWQVGYKIFQNEMSKNVWPQKSASFYTLSKNTIFKAFTRNYPHYSKSYIIVGKYSSGQNFPRFIKYLTFYLNSASWF